MANWSQNSIWDLLTGHVTRSMRSKLLALTFSLNTRCNLHQSHAITCQCHVHVQAIARHGAAVSMGGIPAGAWGEVSGWLQSSDTRAVPGTQTRLGDTLRLVDDYTRFRCQLKRYTFVWLKLRPVTCCFQALCINSFTYLLRTGYSRYFKKSGQYGVFNLSLATCQLCEEIFGQIKKSWYYGSPEVTSENKLLCSAH